MVSVLTKQAPSEKPIAAELRVRLSPTALKLSRLCSTAQFLVRIRGSELEDTSGLLRPFEQARALVRRFHELLAQDTRAAALVLADIQEQLPGLEGLVAKEAERVPASRLQRYLRDDAKAQPDLLARLVETLAAPSQRDADARQKLLSSAVCLARAEGSDASAFRQCLARRRILIAPGDAALPEPLRQRSLELQAHILRMEASSEELVMVCAEMEAYKTELGDWLYTAAGLSEAVALELAFAKKKSSLEDSQMQAFFDLASELEAVAELPGAEPGTAGDREEAPEQPAPGARELLEELETELATSIADNSHHNADFRLEAEEVRAMATEPEDDEATALLRRSAACRTALDRQARLHAGLASSRHEPPPSACATASSLLQTATQLERELQQCIQDALAAGRRAVARANTRSLQRLSRARLGLALVADLPGTGVAQTAGSTQSSPGALVAAGQAGQDQPRPASTDTPSSSARQHLFRLSRETAARSQRRLAIMVVVLIALTIGSVCYHLARTSGAPPATAVTLRDFPPEMPLRSVVAVSGTLYAQAAPGWEGLDAVTQRLHARRLWHQARTLGLDSMLLLSASGDRLLARAGVEGLVIPAQPDSAPD